jgi:hypothetical protein
MSLSETGGAEPKKASGGALSARPHAAALPLQKVKCGGMLPVKGAIPDLLASFVESPYHRCNTQYITSPVPLL